MKSHLLWIIQRPLVLVLEEVLKSLSLSLLSMQLVVSDTPIISLSPLVPHELYSLYLFIFPQLKVPACSTILCRNLFLVTLSPCFASSRSAVPEIKGSDLWLGLSLSNGIFSPLFYSLFICQQYLMFDFFLSLLIVENDFFSITMPIVILRSCSRVTVPIALQVNLECLNNHALKLQDQ